jgi:hypothetical protein
MRRVPRPRNMKCGDRREVFLCFSPHESKITGNVPSVPRFPKFPSFKHLHVRSRSYGDHEKPSGLALTFPASAWTHPRSRLRISHGISSLRAGEFYTTHSKLQPYFAETCIPDDLAQKT